ncbi:hypothetical protein NP570_24705, partial [Vibrio parahaemolyticus]|nr:hypothetical protein [Vibrio parahaemolyticus]
SSGGCAVGSARFLSGRKPGRVEGVLGGKFQPYRSVFLLLFARYSIGLIYFWLFIHFLVSYAFLILQLDLGCGSFALFLVG